MVAISVAGPQMAIKIKVSKLSQNKVVDMLRDNGYFSLSLDYDLNDSKD